MSRPLSSVITCGVLLAACAGGSVMNARAPSGLSPVPSTQIDAKGWLDRRLSPDARADLLIGALTRDEKLTLVTGYFGVQKNWNQYRFPEARPQSAGLVRGVPRVGFPPQWQSDAGSGVATQGEAPPELERTVLPSGILTASTWNPELAEQGGRMIGSEARATGFNVMLAGGVNLLRKLARQPALAEIISSELAPGPHVTSDAQLIEDFRLRSGTVSHPCGTCRMGPDITSAVVDSRLRVMGVAGLRIADASIFPSIISGNTNAPTMMVAAKAGKMILDDHS